MAFGSNEVTIPSTATTGTFTASGVAATQLSMGAWTATMGLVCYTTGSTGKCNSITYANQATALAFAANGLYQ